MARPLFTSHDVWDLSKLPAPFNELPPRSTDPNVFQTPISRAHSPTSSFASMNAYVVRAIIAFADAVVGEEIGVLQIHHEAEESRDISYGDYIVAFRDAVANTTYLSQCKMIPGQPHSLTACKITAQSSVPQQLAIIPRESRKDCEDDLLASYIALLCAAGACSPVLGALVYDAVQAAKSIRQQNQAVITTEFMECAFKASQALYALVAEENSSWTPSTAQVHITLIQQRIPLLPKGGLYGVAVQNAEQIFGDIDVLDSSWDDGDHSDSNAITMADAKKMFKDWADSRQWTAEEEALIPEFPDDFIVPKESLELARYFISTHEMKRPMVNFAWRGVTSYGKSTGVSALAAILHTPLVHMTCHSRMEVQNFLSEFIPDSGDSDSEPILNMPSVEQMYLDPESSYTAITGQEKTGATGDDCLNALIQRAADNAKKESGTPKYKLVESNYVKALARGYICEVEEFSRIQDPGVLVGLNHYDVPGAVIPLVDGSFTRRHKDAMVVWTDNVGYVSCRPVDPSVTRRMAFCLDSYELTKESVLDRVRYNTGFDNEDMLKTMYQTWQKLSKYCETHDITDGPVSVTELEMWAQCVLVDEYANVYDNAIKCLVAKATSDQEAQTELKCAVLDTMLVGMP